MFEKLDIQKKEKTIEVSVKLKKKTLPKQPVVKFSWKDAKALVEQKHPELEINRPVDLKFVLDNKNGNSLEDTWIFPILEKEKPIKKEKKLEANKEKKPIDKGNKQKLSLTKKLKADTVAKTEQSDPPAIVQEPTE